MYQKSMGCLFVKKKDCGFRRKESIEKDQFCEKE